jgi:hypothetical protein
MGMVLASPAEGRVQDFEKWFNEVHIPDVVKVPGFLSGQLFKFHRALDGVFPTQYVAVYHVETDDLEGMFAELDRREKSGEMTFEGSDAINMKSMLGAFFVPVGQRQRPPATSEQWQTP